MAADQKPRLNPGLARQSLGRPLTEVEEAFARDLEAVFAEGVHDFATVAAQLARRGVRRPSGQTGGWTEATLGDELAALNTALDQAYATHGLGA